MPDLMSSENLLLQNGRSYQVHGNSTRLLVLGEVLWDLFDHSLRLGGAPLNFSAHAKRLGHNPLLISAVGNDDLGDRTIQCMSDLGIDTKFLQKTSRYETGTARVELGPG